MTLDQLFSENNNEAGFRVRSLATGRIFDVLMRTPKGKFVIQNVTEPDKEETMVRGDVDRYESLVNEQLAEELNDVNQSIDRVNARIQELGEELREERNNLEILHARRMDLEQRLG